MTFLMNLISESKIDGLKISYYKGIDFNKVQNHPKDGNQGTMIIFIENWIDETKIWQRDNKLNALLENKKINNFNLTEIDNDFVKIYQCENIGINKLYETIKFKMEKGIIIDKPWVPISGIDKGAWKIGKYKDIN